MQYILTEAEHNDLLHYKNEYQKQLKHYQKTGRSFIVDKDTRQLIKVVNQ